MLPSSSIADALALLTRVSAQHAPAVLASSFGLEDMVLIDLVAKHDLPIGVFTLDTGRLPEETHSLIERTRDRYGVTIAVYTPAAHDLEPFVLRHGVNSFYESVALRQQCCTVRKTQPLRRALEGKQAWITGLRRSQSVTRSDIQIEQHDAIHGLRKFNPLADWDDDDVWGYVRARGVPYNTLHDRGYPSIGCAPCTRAVASGEDIRAGRWWWENPEHKECGLHRRPVRIEVAVTPTNTVLAP